MKKFNTAPISGMQELLPAAQIEFNRLKSGIQRAFALHGFQNIETPIIERTDILLAKAGGDTEKQIYKVVKTAEASEGADQALRFDHTVPLARYVVEHMNDLTFPFKVSQVARNFRGERAQKGRFREFYQCDVDVIGWQNLPIAYDAEVISTLVDAMQVLPLEKFVVRVSNRKILTGLLNALGVSERAAEIFNIVDHAEKVPENVTIEALEQLGLTPEQQEKILHCIKINGKRERVIPWLSELEINDETFAQGVAELDEVLGLLSNKNNDRVEVIADMLIVRGLDYYTGTVFETIAPAHREIGSICSGGRYDNLAEYYTEQHLPGVGGSIGLTRLFSVLKDLDLIKNSGTMPVDICLIPISKNEQQTAEQLAEKLRQKDMVIDVVLTDKKLGDKMKYASKIARRVVVIGEDEVKSGKCTVKNLLTGETKELKI